MLVKQHGRNRVHNVLAKSGYGVKGAARTAAGGKTQEHKHIKSALVSGAFPKATLDKRARGGSCRG